jgi:hypothetical protein
MDLTVYLLKYLVDIRVGYVYSSVTVWNVTNGGPVRIIPLTLKQANALILRDHRHHKPVVGHRFSLGVQEDGELIGAAVVGRPVSRELDPYMVAEVTRLVTNGTPNACSMLYGATARAAKAMGFSKIQTYILDSEPGTSLRAAGWLMETTTNGGDWNSSKKFADQGRRTDQPMGPKQRWGITFNELR